MGALFSFPNPVNEKAARVVAAVAAATAVVILATGWYVPDRRSASRRPSARR